VDRRRLRAPDNLHKRRCELRGEAGKRLGDCIEARKEVVEKRMLDSSGRRGKGLPSELCKQLRVVLVLVLGILFLVLGILFLVLIILGLGLIILGLGLIILGLGLVILRLGLVILRLSLVALFLLLVALFLLLGFRGVDLVDMAGNGQGATFSTALLGQAHVGREYTQRAADGVF